MIDDAPRGATCPPEAVTSIRTEAADRVAYAPGLSIDEIKKRYGLLQVIKLASNENPLGTPPLVQQALRVHAGSAFRYAQSGTPDLVRAIGKKYDVPCETIVPGNGSDEVIDLLIRVKASPGRHNIVACKPCFSMYELQAKFCGVTFKQAPLRNDFSFDWDALTSAVDEQTTIVFLTTPDNPSGYCPPIEEVLAFARRLPPSCLLVMDEAYMDFTDDPAAYSMLGHLDAFPGVAILRTFSKSYGLAGLRLGFGIMHPVLASCLNRVRLPFSINIMAEHAGIAALQDTDFHAETLRVTRHGKHFLSTALCEAGCTVYPSAANFIMFALPKTCPLDAQAVFEALLARGIIIRPLHNYALPRHLRLSIGTHHENNMFALALKEILHG